MKAKPRCILLFLVLGSPLFAGPPDNAKEPAGSASTSSTSADSDINAKVRQLWSDVPAYVDQLQNGKSSTAAPRLISSFSPEAPFPLEETQKEKVVVSFVVDEKGNVEAARVLESSDARLNSASLAAVLKWKFQPIANQNGSTRFFHTVPILFQGAKPPPSRSIGLTAPSLAYSYANGIVSTKPGTTKPPPASPPELIVHMELTGRDSATVKAARIVVGHAQDDTGAVLRPGNPADFYRSAVGSISSDDFSRLPRPSLSFSLSAPAASATEIESIDGALELVVPDVDPNATAEFAAIATQLGAPLVSAPLTAAGVTVVVFSRQSIADFHARKTAPLVSPADFDFGPLFGPRRPEMPAGFS